MQRVGLRTCHGALAVPGSRARGRSGRRTPAGLSPGQRPRLLPWLGPRGSCSPPQGPAALYQQTHEGVKSPAAAPRAPQPQHSGVITGCRSYPGAPVTSRPRLPVPSRRLAQPEGHNYRLGNYLCLYKQGRRPLGSASETTAYAVNRVSRQSREGGTANLGPDGSKIKKSPNICTHLHAASLNTGPSDIGDGAQNF